MMVFFSYFSFNFRLPLLLKVGLLPHYLDTDFFSMVSASVISVLLLLQDIKDRQLR